jgi:hypothetical protein
VRVSRHGRDSPELSIFCAVPVDKVYGPLFFAERTVTGGARVGKLPEWLLP